MHQERTNKHANDDAVPDGAVPAYLLDREGVSRAKVLSNTVKQKRKEKAGKWDVPIPKVCSQFQYSVGGLLPSTCCFSLATFNLLMDGNNVP